MNQLLQDIRYAVRGLRGQPGFALAVILVLALGIGANTTMFTVLNAVLLHPPVLRAWRAPHRVVALWETNQQLSAIFGDFVPVRPNTFRQWKRDSRSFQTLAAWRDLSVRLITGKGRPERVSAAAATVDLFPLLGAPFAAGRNFSSAEVRPGAAQVAIVSDEFCRTHFAGAQKAVGSTITVDGKPLTVIGVLPPDVAFPDRPGMDELRPKIWLPLALTPQQEDNNFALFVYGRLKDGVSFATAQAEMKVIQTRMARASKDADGTGLNAVPLVEGVASPDEVREMFILQIAVAFVLLIACANAGNLLLTRTVARGKEMAIRSALGASSLRLLRQTFTESILLTVCAALAGLLFTGLALRVLTAFAPPDAAALRNMAVDRYVLAFTTAAGFLTAILFALAPAWYSRRAAAAKALNSASRGATGAHNRLRGALAIAEIALSVVLVIGAALMIRSLAALLSTDLGFQIEHLLVMDIALPEAQYNTPARISGFDNRLLDSVRSLKGVRNATIATGLPLRALSESTFELPGRAKDPKKPPVTNWARVSDGYFETLGMRLLRGRNFTQEEARSLNPSVAVVNQAFAAKHFPGEDPLGKLAVFSNEAGANTTYRIVGLVANEHQMGPDNDAGSELYLPGSQLKSFLLVARTAGEPAALGSALQQQVWNIDKDQPLAEVKTEQAALDEWLAPRRFNMAVLLGFALLAILLAATGLYSVLAYTVTLRRREIGIRAAVGASPSNIRRYILAGGFKLALAGVAIGLLLSVGVTQFMASLIYGVNPLDPRTFTAVAALVLLISVAASFIPALRAAAVDPAEALRAE